MLCFRIFFIIGFLAITNTARAQQMNPEQIVQENLDFYNNRNINGFMSSFSEDITVYNFGDSEPILVGLERVRDVYLLLFKNSSKLHSTIVKRIVIGNKAIDHESITGRNGITDIIELF